jgi:hypothetical protein
MAEGSQDSSQRNIYGRLKGGSRKGVISTDAAGTQSIRIGNGTRNQFNYLWMKAQEDWDCTILGLLLWSMQ